MPTLPRHPAHVLRGWLLQHQWHAAPLTKRYVCWVANAAAGLRVPASPAHTRVRLSLPASNYCTAETTFGYMMTSVVRPCEVVRQGLLSLLMRSLQGTCFFGNATAARTGRKRVGVRMGEEEKGGGGWDGAH